MATDLKAAEKSLGVEFKNKEILREALTHRSYLNENPNWGVGHNERLEYLGDAVLELAVSEHLYASYPEKEEGEVTTLRAALVNFQLLARAAGEMNLNECVFLSKGESKDTGRAREVILANAMEAVIGAVYLDRGYGIAKAFIEERLLPHLSEVVENSLHRDPKSSLQELAQERMKTTPSYRVLAEEGPAHRKRFQVGVFFGEDLMARGEGFSKQEAEANAARVALGTFRSGKGK